MRVCLQWKYNYFPTSLIKWYYHCKTRDVNNSCWIIFGQILKLSITLKMVLSDMGNLTISNQVNWILNKFKIYPVDPSALKENPLICLIDKLLLYLYSDVSLLQENHLNRTSLSTECNFLKKRSSSFVAIFNFSLRKEFF